VSFAAGQTNAFLAWRSGTIPSGGETIRLALADLPDGLTAGTATARIRILTAR
jgi:hypothetical protein